jgi:hypothetical protein
MYLNGELGEDKEIYMQEPPRYEKGKGQVKQLQKSLYGLKQAGCKWYDTLTCALTDLGCYVCTFFLFSLFIIIPRGLSSALLCHIQYKDPFCVMNGHCCVIAMEQRPLWPSRTMRAFRANIQLLLCCLRVPRSSHSTSLLS